MTWIKVSASLCLFIILVFTIRIALKPSLSLNELMLATVETGDMQATFSASGSIQPQFEEIRTSPVTSAILSIRRNLGDEVKKGDTILVLDTRDIQANLASMRDELALRQNNVEKLKLQLEKSLIDLRTEYQIKELHNERMRIELNEEVYLDSIGGSSKDKIENAQLNLKIARLELEQIRQTIDNREKSMQADLTGLNYEISIQQKTVRELEGKLSRSTIIADRKGVVTSIISQIGLTVNPGDELLKIANLENYEVSGTISDMYASSLYIGNPVLVHLSKGVEIRGVIMSISPTVTNNTVQFRVRLDEENHPLLRPNLKVELHVVKSFKSSVTRVSNGPFYRGATKQVVFIVRDSKLLRKEVRFGESNIDYVEVIEGLSPGEEIVISDMSDYENHEEIALK